MKRYFLIRTSDSEYSSSYKKICTTLEEAKKEVPNFADWWSPAGTCDIHEVDENFTIVVSNRKNICDIQRLAKKVKLNKCFDK
jgi:hypothetical protein